MGVLLFELNLLPKQFSALEGEKRRFMSTTDVDRDSSTLKRKWNKYYSAEEVDRLVDSALQSADSARGVLIWQGSEPARTIVLRTTDGTLTLSGMATTGLSKIVGSEVVVRGVRVSPRDVVVADYYVRAADGVPAFDGVILEDGSLRMSDGSGIKRVPLPGSIQGLTGARVWVAPKDGKPLAYGLIQTR